MHVDYIIVGLGLAGIAFAEELRINGKTFVVYEDNSQNSSLVAGGMYNPVVLKRFTPVWNAKEQLEVALPFYSKLENELGQKFQYAIDIYRVFKSVEEQNNWFLACDKLVMQDYMVAKIIKNKNPFVKAHFALGKLTNTGRVDVNQLAKSYRADLKRTGLLKEKQFKYDEIVLIMNQLFIKI